MTKNTSDLTPVKPDAKDRASDIVSIIGCSAFAEVLDHFGIPGGSGIIEMGRYLLDICMPKTIGQRYYAWQKAVVRFLEELSQKIENLDNFINSDRFKTLFIKSSIIATQTHQQEKIEALKNILVNSAIYAEIKEDLVLTFVRFIDELTPSHLNLLKFIYENEKDLYKLKKYNDLLDQYNSNTYKISQDEFTMLFQELAQRNLIQASSSIKNFEDVYESSGFNLLAAKKDLPMLKITDIGELLC